MARGMLALVLTLAVTGGAAADLVALGTSAGSCEKSDVVQCFKTTTECTTDGGNPYSPGYKSNPTGDYSCCHCFTDCGADGKNDKCLYRDTYNEYVSVSDVTQQSRMTLDVAAFKEKINKKEYTAAKTIYTAGQNSAKGAGKRTLQSMAQMDLTGEKFFDDSVALFGSKTYLDDFMISILDEGVDVSFFKGSGYPSIDAIKELAADAAAQCILTRYFSHELLSAIEKAEAGLTTDDAAPHAWDAGYAFYYGTYNGAGKDSNWKMQQERDTDFGTGNKKYTDDAFKAGLAGVRAGGDTTVAKAKYEEIMDSMMMTSMQGALKHAYNVTKGDYSGSEKTTDMLLGYTLWMCGAGRVYAKDPEAANAVTKAYQETIWNIAGEKGEPSAPYGHKLFCTVQKALSSEKITGAKGLQSGTYDKDFQKCGSCAVNADCYGSDCFGFEFQKGEAPAKEVHICVASGAYSGANNIFLAAALISAALIAASN